ncbi:MAG TPA: hypothetical protein DDY78_24730 [Planctomycetales bacterium]|nr:hypothetical protein [Planctomycetales bacterium]
MKPRREYFVLILESLPDGAPPIIRLRRFLKAALRSNGLRCTRITAMPADPSTYGAACPPGQCADP